MLSSNNKKETNERAVTQAGQMTLLFWALLLLVNAIFESGIRSTFVFSSMTILLAGFVVFFVSYLIFLQKDKRDNKK